MGFDSYYGAADMAAGTAGIMLAVLMVYYLLVIGFSILVYVLQALGMYTIANRRGIHHPWLAWVPFGNLWILGSISDQYQYVSQGKVRSRRKLLVGLQIALCAMLVAMVVVLVIAVVQMAIAGGNYDIAMTGGLALAYVLILVAMLVVAIVLSVFEYICFYNLYASCDPNNKTTYILLSIFIGVTLPFLVFICRKKDLGMPPRKPEPAPYTPEQPAVLVDPPAFEE